MDCYIIEWRIDGAMFSLNPDVSFDHHNRPMSDMTIPNGRIWSKKDDTTTIWQFNFYPMMGAISKKRPYFTMHDDTSDGEDALPDG
ncbi:calcium homeostasis [Pyrenophora seminiperda CCB06]|uniref:Calcium homeostasis n=1 Tax=Pyrenophora seminiperda CCB06 TaxID=1302712 RepID=A0A3M7MBT1_9PLEO|nr:calcium homeostasis [Pyrenophora seminiperda CCB06]